MYGYDFGKIEPKAFEAFGKTYEGGYIPVMYDPLLVKDAGNKKALEDATGELIPTTGRGFAKDRTGYYAPVLLDPRTISGHISQVLRFTHIEPAIKDVKRVIDRIDIDKATRDGMFMPWLARTAKQRVATPTSYKTMDNVFRLIRTAVGNQIMPGNVQNAFLQLTGFSQLHLRVEAGHALEALGRVTSHPFETTAEIIGKSDYMKHRMNNVGFEMQRVIDDIVLNTNKFQQLQSFSEEHAFILQQVAQGYVDKVTWIGAYNQALAKGGISETEAILRADSAVRETQGSYAAEDISRIETGPHILRMFTQYYSYFNMIGNLMVTDASVAMHTGKNGVAVAGSLSLITTLAFVIPGLVDHLLRGGFGGFPEDDEGDLDWWYILGDSQLEQGYAMVPVAGPLAKSFLQSTIGGGYADPFSGRLSVAPSIATMGTFTRTIKDYIRMAQEDEVSTKQITRNTLTVLGCLLGLPLGQIGKPAGYIAGWMADEIETEGDVDFIRGLISGRDVNQPRHY